MTLALLLAAIFIASFILTMVGLGGGLVYAPLFLLVGYPVTTAIPTSLFLNGIAALSAAITYFRRGLIDLTTALPLLLASTAAAPLGALLIGFIDRRQVAAIMAAVLFLAALRMLFAGEPAVRPTPWPIWLNIVGGGLIGVLVGLVGGVLGIGGGVFIVPLLIYGLRLPTKAAAATSIFIVIFPSFSGFVAHVALTPPDWHFIGLAALFSFAGGQLGSRLMSAKMKGRAVRQIFAVVLLLLCAKLLQRAFL
ncbi:MAG: sulfite exporter TauE/SafE family protein [Desulfosarcinaceae bacterium]|nr:sulfite exporter TauE/SafE family protein [Desulfosarcinaceae bacterium]